MSVPIAKGRILVTVRTYCRPLRKAWKDACHQLGIMAEMVQGHGDKDENGHYNTTTYHCVGDAKRLGKLVDWSWCDACSRYKGPIVNWAYPPSPP